MIATLFDGEPARLAALHATSLDDPWSSELLGSLLSSPGVFAFTAGAPDGFILVRVAGGEAEILTLAVRPGARRKGMGAALILYAARHARMTGAETMFLEVSVANHGAKALYAASGFSEVGRRKAYYGSVPPDDALILRADLGASPLGNSRLVD